MTEDSAAAARRARNPAAEPDSSPGKQSELKLNVGIGILGTILSVFVAVIFFFLEHLVVLGIVFSVVALVSLLITLYAAQRKRKARPQS
jgi:VIT1/CCC1 family predicted Fe2+/Mn2+ transporter